MADAPASLDFETMRRAWADLSSPRGESAPVFVPAKWFDVLIGPPPR